MDFQFNENGICTNPNVFFSHVLSSHERTEISTARHPELGLWFAASSCSYKSSGSSSGVGFGQQRMPHLYPGHDTEKSAALACMQNVLERHRRSSEGNWVNSPQAIALMQRRVDELTGKLGVQADLFAMAA